MNIFISGGCKNGKSYHAQELARSQAQVRMEEAVAKITDQLGVPVAALLREVPAPGAAAG